MRQSPQPRLRRPRPGTAAMVGGLGVIALGVLAQWATRRHTPEVAYGVAANGMEYAVMGSGPNQLLYLPGGFGPETRGFMGKLSARHLAPYVEAGYTAWIVTRRRNMPAGYSVADMADDYAGFIRDHLDGQADLAIGTSYGGLILAYLAANHPDTVRRAVLSYAAATITPSGKELDLRLARAKAEGRYGATGAIALELTLPGDHWAPVRRALGLPLGWLAARTRVPAGDILIEADAEYAYDARDAMPRIQAPVLLASGAGDRYFPHSVVAETAALIADCTVIRYPGSHLGGMSARIPPDVLAWVAERHGSDRSPH